MAKAEKKPAKKSSSKIDDLSPMHNIQRDGHMRQTINAGKTSCHPKSISEGSPLQAKVRVYCQSSILESRIANKQNINNLK